MRTALLGGLLAAMTSPVFAQDVTIDTATGPATVAANPETIAVFDIAAIDTLAALGVQIDGIPDRLLVSYLDDVSAKATSVGTLFEPNLEALAVLAPELVIVGGRSSAQAEATTRIAPTIDMTITGEGIVDQAKARIAAYGTLFDKTDAAETLIADIDAKITTARAAVEGKGNGLIILTNGPKISAYGPGSRFGWLHDAVGLPVAVDDLDVETHGQAISFEFIAETNPDWLLVVDRGAAIGQDGVSAQATLDNPLIAQTSAAKNGQIIYLDAAAMYVAGGGATALQASLDDITNAFTSTN